MLLLERLNRLQPNYHFTEAYVAYNKRMDTVGIYLFNSQLLFASIISTWDESNITFRIYEINDNNLNCYALTSSDWVKIGPIKFDKIFDTINTLLLLA